MWPIHEIAISWLEVPAGPIGVGRAVVFGLPQGEQVVCVEDDELDDFDDEDFDDDFDDDFEEEYEDEFDDDLVGLDAEEEEEEEEPEPEEVAAESLGDDADDFPVEEEEFPVDDEDLDADDFDE